MSYSELSQVIDWRGLVAKPLSIPLRSKLQIQLQKLQITNMLRDNSIINTLFAGVVWYLKQSF